MKKKFNKTAFLIILFTAHSKDDKEDVYRPPKISTAIVFNEDSTGDGFFNAMFRSPIRTIRHQF